MDEKLEKYWDEIFKILQPIGMSKEMAIKLLKQIATDQREACVKEVKDLWQDSEDDLIDGELAFIRVGNAEIEEGK